MSSNTESLKSRYGVDDTVIDTATRIAHQLSAAGITTSVEDILSVVNSVSRQWVVEWRDTAFDELCAIRIPADYNPHRKHWQSPRFTPKRKR